MGTPSLQPMVNEPLIGLRPGQFWYDDKEVNFRTTAYLIVNSEGLDKPLMTIAFEVGRIAEKYRWNGGRIEMMERKDIEKLKYVCEMPDPRTIDGYGTESKVMKYREKLNKEWRIREGYA